VRTTAAKWLSGLSCWLQFVVGYDACLYGDGIRELPVVSGADFHIFEIGTVDQFIENDCSNLGETVSAMI